MPMYERRTRQQRQGFLLIVVLVVVAILALSVLSFASRMLVEVSAARAATRQAQSKHLVDSAMEYARVFLSQPQSEIVEAGRLWNNEEVFRDVDPMTNLVSQDQRVDFGRFSIIAPNINGQGELEGTRYGLVDESSKININVLPVYARLGEVILEDPLVARNLLMALPNMTEEIADAIVDFVDSDSEEEEFGAESDYYESLTPSYGAKNGPLDSIEELLLVRGVTQELLFGRDTNRNGVVEEFEANNTSIGDTASELGWANYLTLYSKESNLMPGGGRRININSNDLNQLHEDLKAALGDDWANFVLLYRLGYSRVEQVDESIPVVAASEILVQLFDDTEAPLESQFRSVLDLMDVTFDAFDIEGNEVIVRSPLQSKPLGNGSIPVALQSMTVFDSDTIVGRINILQAPRVIIEGLPVFRDDPELVDALIARREIDLDDPLSSDRARTLATFLLEEGYLSLGRKQSSEAQSDEADQLDEADQPNDADQPDAAERMRRLIPFVCSGGDVFRAEIVGYFEDSPAITRAEVILDTTLNGLPEILMWQDKNHLQLLHSNETLGR